MRLKRIDATDKGIFGQLQVDDLQLVTLERHDICIPQGTYKVTMYNSPDHGCVVPLLNNVPGRSFIEIHWGNWEKDSKGCILVGMKRDGDAIDSSRQAFDLMMTKLQFQVDIDITIS